MYLIKPNYQQDKHIPPKKVQNHLIMAEGGRIRNQTRLYRLRVTEERHKYIGVYHRI